MKDASKVLSPAYCSKVDQETSEKEWKKLDKSKQKKWTQDFIKTSLEAWAMVVDNANETVAKITAVKDSMKTAIEGMEKIIEDKRKSNTQLTDAERAWIKKGQTVIDGSAGAVDALTDQFSKFSPMAARGEYFASPLKVGAISKDQVNAIKAARSKGIDLGNDFGKSGVLTRRMEEFRKRWAVLIAELDGLQKRISGESHQWAANLTKQIKAFADGNEKWSQDLEAMIGKVSRNITGLLGLIENTTPKGFGPSLVKAVKLKVSEKARTKAAFDAVGVSAYLNNMRTFLKEAKGSLKTRLVEFKSLNEQLKDAGEHAEPFRKTLATIGVKLVEQQKTIDELAVSVDEAISAAGK